MKCYTGIKIFGGTNSQAKRVVRTLSSGLVMGVGFE